MGNQSRDLKSESRSAGDLARNIGDELKDEGRRLIEDAKASALEIASDRRDAATTYVGAVAGAARSGADELKQSGYPRTAATISRTSADVESFAKSLSQRSPASLVEDLEDFARERPLLTFGLAFAAAFGATRFLRSSGDSDQQAEQEAGQATEREASGATNSSAGRSATAAGL